jgi:recombination protein RecT
VFKDGSRTFHALSKEQVEWVRDHSRGYQMAKKNRKESPWDTHFVPMGLKTVIRRLCNLLPKSPELAMALAMDELNERGKTQNIGMAEAIDGSWAPVIDEQPDDAGQASDPARVATRKPLADLLASIGQALSIEALDEVYAQAEDFVAGDDLEQLLRAYRSRKAALTQPSQLSPSSPIRGVVNSPSV